MTCGGCWAGGDDPVNKVKLANSTIPVDVDKVRAWQRSARGLQRSGLTLVSRNGTAPARKPRPRDSGPNSEPAA